MSENTYAYVPKNVRCIDDISSAMAEGTCVLVIAGGELALAIRSATMSPQYQWVTPKKC